MFSTKACPSEIQRNLKRMAPAHWVFIEGLSLGGVFCPPNFNRNTVNFANKPGFNGRKTEYKQRRICCVSVNSMEFCYFRPTTNCLLFLK